MILQHAAGQREEWQLSIKDVKYREQSVDSTIAISKIHGDQDNVDKSAFPGIPKQCCIENCEI